MSEKITIDPHYLSGEKETWSLRFTHSVFRSPDNWNADKRIWESHDRIGICLEAERPGKTVAQSQNILVATASFQPGKKPELLKFSTHPDAEGIVSALVEQGYGKKIGERTERYQDYPGADEIEEFRYQYIDLTDFYNQYMAEHQKRAMKDPFSHFVQCQGQVMNGRDPMDYMKCRIGGIEQNRAWSGITGRKFFEVASLYPDCRFQLNEMAQETFQKQLETYKQAQQRVTDATIVFNQKMGCHYLRCKIDGEQQLMKELERLDVCDFQISKDIHALAAKYYEKELDTGMKRSQGRSL